MGEIRRGFTREFKVEAVRQVVEGERTVVEVARDLEISRNVLYRWKRQVTAETDAAFPGNGRRPAEPAELHRLRRELATVREERDFLKKAIAFFAKYHTLAEVRADVFEYIECWYNVRRRHSSLAYLSPATFERLHDV